MRKFTILLILSTLVIGSLISQPCLPEGITFTSQSMIDDFPINYPDCDIIEGDLRIQGDNITNLDGLSSITGIEGDLEIFSNDNLTSLSGLSNLTYVGTDFWIEENPLLTNFSGLNNLASIGRGFEAYFNNQLTNFTGLDSLSFIGNYLWIISNEKLEDLTGLSSLNTIGVDILINECNSLTSLSGLENLTSPILYFALVNNPVLTDISAVGNLSSIGTLMAIQDNNNLDNLAGLEDIKLDSLDHLSIKRNPMLSECAIQNICDFLSDSIGDVGIEENATGCYNPEEVIAECYDGIDENINNKMPVIYPNPARDILNIETYGEKIDEIFVYNELGQKLVFQFNDLYSIDVSNLISGIYIIEMNINNTRVRKSFVISK